MALTRPKIYDIDTSSIFFNDPIMVLHQGATSANVDVGFLFNRANGLVSNVALYWNESSQSFVTAFTANTGVTDSNVTPSSYANLTVGNVLLVNGSIAINGNLGLSGQYIVSTGSGMAWTAASFTGGTITNALTVSNTTSSTSKTTGALVVNGGAGISGDVYSGNLNIGGLAQAGLSITSSLSNRTASIAFIDQYNLDVNPGAGYLILSRGNQNIGLGGNTSPVHRMSLTGDAYMSGNLTLVGNVVSGTVPILRSSSVTSTIATAPQAIDWFGSSVYRTGKYVVSTTDVTNSWYQSVEIILVQDGTTSTITSYGLISTSGNTRMTFTSNIMAGNVILWATGVSASNTVKLDKKLIPV